MARGTVRTIVEEWPRGYERKTVKGADDDFQKKRYIMSEENGTPN
jgi:hypothetical protein